MKQQLTRAGEPASPLKRYDTPGYLYRKTRALLQADERPMIDIHNQTRIPFYWLKKFAAGEMQNPSVNRVEYLYTALTGKRLQL